MIRLIADDPEMVLDDSQVLRVQSCLLELVPAHGCKVEQERPVQILVTGHRSERLHPPLLQRVEQIAGCTFQVSYEPD